MTLPGVLTVRIQLLIVVQTDLRQSQLDQIILMLLCNIDERLIDVLKRHLEEAFGSTVTVRNKIGNLEYAYQTNKKQYLSPRILSRLQRIKKAPRDKILGIVNVDLYAPGYDFVYGEANQSSGVATLSTYRLLSRNRSVQPNLEKLKQRLVREGLHEVGHLYGLGHCSAPKCVMRTCTCLKEVDKAGNTFCCDCGQNSKTS